MPPRYIWTKRALRLQYARRTSRAISSTSALTDSVVGCDEIEEVIEADSIDDVAWEVADVIYQVLVKARGRDVSLMRVCDELRSRMRD